MSTMEDPLNLENRRRLYRLINDSPGTHLREIQRELGMPSGLLSYHLDYLERRGLIRSEDDGYRKRYFIADQFRLRDRRIISLLRQDSPRKIIIHLLLEESSSFSEIREALGISKSTLSYHMKKLTKSGLVLSEIREREKFYRLEDPEGVMDMMVSIRSVIEPDTADRFAEIWDLLAER
jgi:predicted transcriptional regulator